jgi:hypothetical protein
MRLLNRMRRKRKPKAVTYQPVDTSGYELWEDNPTPKTRIVQRSMVLPDPDNPGYNMIKAWTVEEIDD